MFINYISGEKCFQEYVLLILCWELRRRELLISLKFMNRFHHAFSISSPKNESNNYFHEKRSSDIGSSWENFIDIHFALYGLLFFVPLLLMDKTLVMFYACVSQVPFVMLSTDIVISGHLNTSVITKNTSSW